MNQSKFNKQEVTSLLQQCLGLVQESHIEDEYLLEDEESAESYIFESEYDFNAAIEASIDYLFEHEVLGKIDKDVTQHLVNKGVGNSSPTDKSYHKTGGGLNKHAIAAIDHNDTAAISYKSGKGHTVVYRSPHDSDRSLTLVHKDEHGNVTKTGVSKSAMFKHIHKLHGIDSGEQTHSDITLNVHKNDDAAAKTQAHRKATRKFEDRLATNAGNAAGKLFDKKLNEPKDDSKRHDDHNKAIHAHIAELLKHHEKVMKTSDAYERQNHVDNLKDALDKIRVATNDYHHEGYKAETHRAVKSGKSDKLRGETVENARDAKYFSMKGRHKAAKSFRDTVLGNLR